MAHATTCGFRFGKEQEFRRNKDRLQGLAHRRNKTVTTGRRAVVKREKTLDLFIRHWAAEGPGGKSSDDLPGRGARSGEEIWFYDEDPGACLFDFGLQAFVSIGQNSLQRLFGGCQVFLDVNG